MKAKQKARILFFFIGIFNENKKNFRDKEAVGVFIVEVDDIDK